MAAIVAVAIAMAAPAADARPKGEPDLTPKAGEFKGEPFGFIGKRMRAKVTDVVVNQGSRRAGPTLTRVYFRRGDIRPRQIADRAVGGLKPGERDRGDSDVRGVNDHKPGKYGVMICVDAKDQVDESNEGNNCKKVRGSTFYSTYETWEGSTNGTAPGIFGSEESWRSAPDASFGFDGYLGGGLFSWALEGGAVKYTTQGSNGGCSYSGSATFVLDRRFGQLLLNYETDTYTASAGVIPGATYQVVENCSGSIFNRTARPHMLALFALQQNLRFGSDMLKGTFADPAVQGVRYSWNLAGK